MSAVDEAFDAVQNDRAERFLAEWPAPYNGRCAYCHRDDMVIFWHRFDRVFYCCDVWGCQEYVHE
jgi:ssDNA-binding Zn-finger/Zn-ribbon topoisomerase 1